MHHIELLCLHYDLKFGLDLITMLSKFVLVMVNLLLFNKVIKFRKKGSEMDKVIK